MSESDSWRIAASPPPPTFDAAGLAAYLRIIGNPMPLIRAGLDMIPTPAWGPSHDALSVLFGLADPNHCFHVAPHGWTRFHEPQITGGFAHFLGSGDAQRRLGRAIAFVKAAAMCAGKDPMAIDAFGASAVRCVAEENRTDIMVELRSGNRKTGASIEAKFGHSLTKGQLPKALRHARENCGWSMEGAIFLVVAPDELQLDGPVMRVNRNFGWRGASWWTFLTYLEQITDAADDCSDYRRFRRTVWHRVY